MHKKILSTIISFTILILLTSPASAVSVSPNSGTVSSSSTQTIEILASPNVSNAKAVALRLTVSNGTITGYTSPPESANFLTLGACNGSGAKYTATEVCVDLAKTGTNQLSSGESIGSITVQFGASGTTTVTAADDNGYLAEGEVNVNPQTGQLASFTISTTGGGGGTSPTTPGGVNPTTPGGVNPTTPGGELPKTAITDYPIAAFGGAAAVLFGAGLYIYTARARASLNK